MNYFKLASATLFTFIVLSLTGCLNDNDDQALITSAQLFFEENAKALSLPILGPDTEVIRDITESVYPSWNKAIVSHIEGKRLVEVPLSGDYRIIGATVFVKDTTPILKKATVVTYLVFEYPESSSTPITYVETFAEEGNSCNLTASSDLSNIVGLKLLSKPNGIIYNQEVFNHGVIHSSYEKEDSCNCHKPNKLKYDYLGFRLAYSGYTGTKIGCVGGGEAIICFQCGQTYYGSITNFDLTCPFCGAKYHDMGGEYCPSCGKKWNQCACQNPEGSCAPCGRNVLNCDATCSQSAYCICE